VPEDLLTAAATPATLDQVIARMDAEVERAVRERSRLGYFAALYREVTRRVADGIRAERFEDGPRMERFAVIFANRYLDALDRHRAGDPPPKSWAVAFSAASRWPPLILQHLLAGMNAHIGLDLGIAAARAAPGAQLPGMRGDFEAVTDLLGELVDEIQDRIARVSPWMWIVDKAGGRTDEIVCTFCLDRSRRLAWKWATHLADTDPAREDVEVAALDLLVAGLGLGILTPPEARLRLALLLVRIKEKQDVGRVVRALSDPAHA